MYGKFNPLLFQLLIFYLSKVCLLLSPRCLDTCQKQVPEQDLKMLLFKTILWIWKLFFLEVFLCRFELKRNKEIKVIKTTNMNENIMVKYPSQHLSAQIYSKLTIKSPERRQWRRSGVFTVNSEHTLHLGLVFLLLTLNM